MRRFAVKYHDEDMLAVVCRAPHDYKLENVKRPAAGPNEVIIKIMSCGICAGDCKGFAGAPRFWGDKEAGRPSYIKAPVISGHEFWGVVCELGEGAFWHPLRRQAFWFDIHGRRLLSQEDGRDLQWGFDEKASAMGWIDGDRVADPGE